eukprot:Awhi_evm1s9901
MPDSIYLCDCDCDIPEKDSFDDDDDDAVHDISSNEEKRQCDLLSKDPKYSNESISDETSKKERDILNDKAALQL